MAKIYDIATIHNAKLCYVEGSFAYFTTQNTKDQWGDDWDDAPYEHNAEPPYDWSESYDGPKWEIVKVGWEGPFITPAYSEHDSLWTVKAINRKEIAWLREAPYNRHGCAIFAGDTLVDFYGIITSIGGHVLVDLDIAEQLIEYYKKVRNGE